MSLPETAPESGAAPKPAIPAQADIGTGVWAALGSYAMWGFLPIHFRLLSAVPAAMIVAERTVWSLLLLAIILFISRRMDEVRAIFADGARVRRLALCAVILGVNWLIYVWAVETEQVLEASFGYFINPLVSVAIGMVFLGERQNSWQVVAIAIACVAIAVQAIGLGSFPVIAVGLALTFGFYGFFRKTAKVGSTSGLFVETLILAPLGLAYIAYITATAGPGPHADPWTLFLLIMTGPVTAVPLMLFAYGVQRLRLTTIGMLQYLAPTLQFLVAILLFGEPLNSTRLISFGLIWVSIAIFTADGLRQRRARAAA
jgi:chloramphenicol-sensitive protein RarD